MLTLQDPGDVTDAARVRNHSRSAHADSYAAPMIDGTVSSHVARLVRTTALQIGVAPGEIACLPGMEPDTLADDLIRVPTSSVIRLWELIGAIGGPEAGLRAAENAELGRLHVWDYLITTGKTLADGFQAAASHLAVLTDPSVAMTVVQDDRLLTVRYGGIEPEWVVAPIEEFVLALLLRRAREADQSVVPLRMSFTHKAPRSHRNLIDVFGIRHLDFGAPANAITFHTPAPRQPHADPELGHIMRRYADLALASAKTIPSWQDKLRIVLTEALSTDELSLHTVSHRLAMSPRTLQRRLSDDGTSWRAQIETVRQEQARNLLRDTQLPVQAIAARLGYTDARSLRRAFHRWTRQSPDDYRRHTPIPPESEPTQSAR